MGWLGWTPDMALDTPFPLIRLAIDGKIDFAEKSSPFGKPKPQQPVTGNVADQVKAAMSELGAKERGAK